MKKTMPKIAFIILSIVFVLSTCMVVFATTSKSVTEEQNGVEATLNFNKQEYEANEKVEVTLNVKNNNSYAVKNIQTEIFLPSTMKISTGSLTQEAFSLNAEESKLQEIAIEKVVETGNNVSTSNSPQTGDNVVIYVVMMVISASAFIFIAVKKKWIHKKGIMSLVLCFTLLGTMALTSVVNAESTSKDFTVEGTIKYDGEDISVKAKISYMYEIYSKVQIDGEDKGIYVEGDTVTITADEAPEGKHFAGWTVVKGNVTLDNANSSTTTFIMGNEDVEIKTNYEVNTYTIEVTSGENGKVSPAGEVNVNYGNNKTFTITPNTGYHIVDVKVDGESKGAIESYSFENVNSNHKLEVTFAINTYTITTSSNSGGTITESATVNYGDSKTFNITANDGYGILNVKVDGKSIGAKSSYEFKNVTENHTIDVTFDSVIQISDGSALSSLSQGSTHLFHLSNNVVVPPYNVTLIEGTNYINGNKYSISYYIAPDGYRIGELVVVRGSLTLDSVSLSNFRVGIQGEVFVVNSNIGFISLGGGSATIWSGSVDDIVVSNESKSSVIRIFGGEVHNVTLFEEASVEIYGGTFYFDPSNYVDSSTHAIRQSTDGGGNTIWVVTEK